MPDKKNPYLEKLLNARVELDEARLESIAQDEKKREIQARISSAQARQRTESEHSLARQRLQWAGKGHPLPRAARLAALGASGLSLAWFARSLWVLISSGPERFFELAAPIGFVSRPHLLGVLQGVLWVSLAFVISLGSFHSSLDNQLPFTGLPDSEVSRAQARLRRASAGLHLAQLVFCVAGTAFAKRGSVTFCNAGHCKK